jgi:hypothetical protein
MAFSLTICFLVWPNRVAMMLDQANASIRARLDTFQLCVYIICKPKESLKTSSSGTLRRVALVRTDVSEEHSASIIRVKIGELGTTLGRTPIHVTLMMEALSSSETSVLTRTTRRNVIEDDILHSHCRENLKSYKRFHYRIHKIRRCRG